MSEAEHLDRRSRSIGVWRLVVVIGAGGILAWWNYWLLPIPVLAFVGFSYCTSMLRVTPALTARAIAFYERGSRGSTASGPARAKRACVFWIQITLMPATLTFSVRVHCSSWCAPPVRGRRINAGIMVEPAATEKGVSGRQAAVDELAAELDLREDMALLGEDIRSGLHADTFADGVRASYAGFPLSTLRNDGFSASLTTLAVACHFFFRLAPLSPFLLGVLLEIALLMQVGTEADADLCGGRTSCE